MKKLTATALLATAALSAAAFTTTKTEDLHVWIEWPEEIIADGTTVNYIKVFEHDDNNYQYTAFNMEIILPEGFSVNQVKQGRETVNDIFLSERASTTHSIACNIVRGVDLKVFCDSSVNANLYNDDEDGNPLDELFTVGLICAPTVATGQYDVTNTGIKFVFKNADACVPAAEPIHYTINILNTSKPTGIEDVEAVDGTELNPEDCYDLAGRRVDPTAVHGIIVVSKSRKFYIK